MLEQVRAIGTVAAGLTELVHVWGGSAASCDPGPKE